MKMLLASHNKNKMAELSRILSPLGIEVVTDNDLGISLTEVEETGETFEENSLLKAKSGCEESGYPCIADDSGLCVDALDGAPGVYSARYSGGGDKENIKKLLEELKDTCEKDRTAQFVCVITCLFPDGRKIQVRGECKGKIAFEASGEGGFGYDPVFTVDSGKTFAELSKDEKDKISHRGNALRLLVKELEKNI